VNLTRATTFSEFVSEIRHEQRSHVLLMSQHADPVSVRVDVIRDYPELAVGSQRWDERVEAAS
jgi:hypothetical protein